MNDYACVVCGREPMDWRHVVGPNFRHVYERPVGSNDASSSVPSVGGGT